MNEATIALTVMTFLIFVIFLGFLIWGIKSGQFKNVEEAKLIPFRNEGSNGSKEDAEEDPSAPAKPSGSKGEVQ